MSPSDSPLAFCVSYLRAQLEGAEIGLSMRPLRPNLAKMVPFRDQIRSWSKFFRGFQSLGRPMVILAIFLVRFWSGVSDQTGFLIFFLWKNQTGR